MGRVQKGKKERPVGAGTVRSALRGINTPIALEKGKQPLHQIDGEHYIKTIQHMLAGFKNFETSVEKKLVVHLDPPKFATAYKKTVSGRVPKGDRRPSAYYVLLPPAHG